MGSGQNQLQLRPLTHLLMKSKMALNNKFTAEGIFCNLEKASACVNHDILLYKLELYGVTGTENVFYKSYLHTRYKRLVKNKNSSYSTLSYWAKIEHSVPHSFLLGPPLLLYTNDLPLIINNISIPIIFADDTSILFTNSNLTNYNKDIPTVFKLTNKFSPTKF